MVKGQGKGGKGNKGQGSPNHKPANDPSFQVKNTFVEFGQTPDNEFIRGRRAKSDVVPRQGISQGSPPLHPVSEGKGQGWGYPGADGGADVVGGNEPAYVMPGTPSPFLHPSFAPTGMLPPFGGYGFEEMGLGPAFCEGDNPYAMMQNPYMGGMYDPSLAPYMYYGGFNGGMPLDPSAFEGLDAEGQRTEGTGVVVPPPTDEWTSGAAGTGRRDSEKRGKGRNGREQRDQEKADARAEKAEARAEKAARAADWVQNAGSSSAAGGGGAPAPVGPEFDGCTTIMLRNIPNKYTREMLVKQLNQDFGGRFDFLYLPIDFKNKCNVGYGFINFRTPEWCGGFVSQFHGIDVRKCLPGLNSKKVVEVTPARVQGLVENVRRLKNSPVMNQLADHPEWMPLLFDEDGNEEPFPMPDQPLPPVKPRGRGREALLRDNA